MIPSIEIAQRCTGTVSAPRSSSMPNRPGSAGFVMRPTTAPAQSLNAWAHSDVPWPHVNILLHDACQLHERMALLLERMSRRLTTCIFEYLYAHNLEPQQARSASASAYCGSMACEEVLLGKSGNTVSTHGVVGCVFASKLRLLYVNVKHARVLILAPHDFAGVARLCCCTWSRTV